MQLKISERGIFNRFIDTAPARGHLYMIPQLSELNHQLGVMFSVHDSK